MASSWRRKHAIWSLAALAGVAMGPVFITVIGQCMENGNTEGAEYYFRKLTKITLLISVIWNLLIFLLTPVFLHFYSLSPETRQLVVWLVLIHNVFNAAVYPFPAHSAMGFVRQVIFTISVRLFLSWLFGIVLQLGVIGIALAMVCDWANVHPLLKVLPMEWDHCIPYGILHSPNPIPTVQHFLDAAKAVSKELYGY